MKKTFIKIISVFLTLSLIFSLVSSSVSAEQNTAAEAVKKLEKDIPIVEVVGFGGDIVKGLSTETELDDVSVWGISGDEISALVKEHILGLLLGLMTGDFAKLDIILMHGFLNFHKSLFLTPPCH